MSYGHNRHGNNQEKGSNINAAPAEKIGEAFHNPYTFIPFPDSVERYSPTALSIDEHADEAYRKSGILELEIKTLSPLMSCSSVAASDTNGHKSYRALTIDNDVIVPATGVRGALRTLMTTLTGGTLGYMDENLWLTQGRAAQLGPKKVKPQSHNNTWQAGGTRASSEVSNEESIPESVFLAKVVRPGTAANPGVIELGDTKLKKYDELKRTVPDLEKYRPTSKRQPTQSYQGWDVKLSGSLVGGDDNKDKREGLFRGNGNEIELRKSLWDAYRGLHRRAVASELEKGDLVWLEPRDSDCRVISTDADIESIQWARWGRRGKKFTDIIIKSKHRDVRSDSRRGDGLVDWVTDLFGQIPHHRVPFAAGPFAARIRPGNLVFLDAKGQTTRETLAPLMAPHPGCIAFYHDADDNNLDNIGQDSPLKGYKVYRNTLERGDTAPWKYSVQGVYNKGELSPAQQKFNKTADLLNEGMVGKLRVSFRALSDADLALLYLACSVDWKLGGGKPLGLGHCRVVGLKMIDEEGNVTSPLGVSNNGENLQMDPADAEFVENLQKRVELYKTSQQPVKKLRYPRAVEKSTRGGHAWFSRHASPKMANKNKLASGLKTLWTRGSLQKKVRKTQIRAQALPKLQVNQPDSDLLYGYDMVALETKKEDKKNKVGKLEKFNPDTHDTSYERKGANTSQNRETRQQQRQLRTASPAGSMIRNHTPLTRENIAGLINEELKSKILNKARAIEILQKLEEFDITPEQSNKWAKKFKILNTIASRD